MKNIFDVYEDNISVSQCQRWLKKCQARNDSIKDKPNAERPDELDKDVLWVTVT